MRASTVGSKVNTCLIAVLALASMANCAQGAVHKKSQPPLVNKDIRTLSSSLKAPAFVLPAGTVVLTEINLNESDLLAMMKQSIPSFAKGASGAQGEMGDFIQKMNLNQLYDAIKQVKAVKFTQFQMSKKMDVYKTFIYLQAQSSPSKGWERVFYKTSVPGEDVMAVYAKDKHFLGMMLSSKNNRNIVFGTAGFINIPILSNWIGNFTASLSNAPDEDGCDKDPQTQATTQEEPAETDSSTQPLQPPCAPESTKAD